MFKEYFLAGMILPGTFKPVGNLTNPLNSLCAYRGILHTYCLGANMNLKTLVENVVFVACVGAAGYWLYHSIYSPSKPRKAEARYHENTQMEPFEEDDNINRRLDDCQRYVDPSLVQSCIKARSKP